MYIMIFWLDFCVRWVFLLHFGSTHNVYLVFKLQLTISVYVQGVICIGARML